MAIISFFSADWCPLRGDDTIGKKKFSKEKNCGTEKNRSAGRGFRRKGTKGKVESDVEDHYSCE